MTRCVALLGLLLGSRASASAQGLVDAVTPIRVPAPLGKPAAFVREGSLVARELLGSGGMTDALEPEAR